MTDANKFINNYIEISTNALHEYLNQTLQLKTQLKLANEIIQEKDKLIGQLSAEQSNTNINADTNHQLQEDVRLLNQKLIEKDQQISSLSDQIEKSKNDLKEFNDLRQRFASLDESNTAMRNKISHMETLTKQVNEMKNEVIKSQDIISQKENTIDKLNETIEQLNAKIVELNTKKAERPAASRKKINESKITMNAASDFEIENDDF